MCTYFFTCHILQKSFVEMIGFTASHLILNKYWNERGRERVYREENWSRGTQNLSECLDSIDAKRECRRIMQHFRKFNFRIEMDNLSSLVL